MNLKFWNRPRYFDFSPVRRTVVVLHDFISAIIAAIGSVISFLGSSTVVGVSIGGTVYGVTGSMIGSLVVSAALSVASTLLSGGEKPSSQNFRTGKELANDMSIGSPIRPLYGCRRIGGTRVFVWTTTGNNLKYLHLIVVWGEGPMKGPVVDGAGEKIWLDDKRMQYFQTYKGLNLCYHEFHGGTHDQTVSAELQSYIPTWNEAMRFTAYSYFRFKYNQTAWGNLPTVTAAMEGCENLFDPRDGSHGYSRNGVLATRDFVTHPRYGGGTQGSLLNDTSVGDCATWVENVSHQYYFDGCIQERQPFADNTGDMMANFKGDIVWSGGQYKFIIYKYDAAVVPIDEFFIEENPGGNALGIDTGSSEETPRRIKGYFSDPTDNYNPKPVYWPQVAADVAESDKIASEFSLIGTCSYEQALRLLKYNYLRMRFSKTFNCNAHPSLYPLELGDIFSVSHNADIPGSSIPVSWTLKPLRLQGWSLTQTNKLALQAIEEDSSIYDETVEVVAHDPYVLTLPGYDDAVDTMPTNLTASTGKDDSTRKTKAYMILGCDRVEGAEAYEFRYRQPDKSNWSKKTFHDPGGEVDVAQEDPGNGGTLKMESGGDYYGAAAKTIVIEIDGDGDPCSFKVSYDNGESWEETEIDITADWQDLDDGLRLRFDGTIGGAIGDRWTFSVTPPDAVSIYLGGLPTNQQYYWQVCAIVDKKKSEWATPTAPVTTWYPDHPSAPTGLTAVMMNTDDNLSTAEVLVSWDDPVEGEDVVSTEVKKEYTDDPYLQFPNGIDTGSAGRAAGLIISPTEPETPMAGMLWVKQT